MRFIDILGQLAALDDARLEDPLPVAIVASRFTVPADVETVDTRYGLLFRALEAEQEAIVRARIAYRGSEAQRILGLAQVAFGDLRGVLAGVSGDHLDHEPREGEWSARRALVHTINGERSYRAQVTHAVGRAGTEPLLLPAERRPQPDPADTEGDGSAVAERLAARRSETDAELGRTPDDRLTRPSQWGWGPKAVGVDVRFRLHRFASHIVEHTIQVERALEAAGVTFGDARRTVRRISIARAMHERITSADDLARLDAEHEARMRTPVTA